jgi:uncharacterized protein YdeI (YjbR/CyaY-like superfamily)
MTPPIAEHPLLEVSSREQWRSWLLANHATSPGVWLAIGKKGNQVTARGYEDTVEEALCFGWLDGRVSQLDEARFKQHRGPRKRGSIWARSNQERVARLAEPGLLAPAGVAAVASAQADGSWTLLDEVDALVIPEDLAVALAGTPETEGTFAALPPSARKMALYWIASARRPATRARRIAETVGAAAGRATRPPN